MKPYTPRQKRLIMPIRQMKCIKIDAKTTIEVDANIPDAEAIERFYFRNKGYSRYIPVTPNYPLKDEFKEVSMGSLEELASIIDDSELPEIE